MYLDHIFQLELLLGLFTDRKLRTSTKVSAQRNHDTFWLNSVFRPNFSDRLSERPSQKV